jgi:hypothetical protein
MLLISGSPRVHLAATVTNPTFRPDPRVWKIGEDQGFREDFWAR